MIFMLSIIHFLSNLFIFTNTVKFCGGAYIRWEFAFQIGQAYTWREIYVSKLTRLAYSRKESYVRNQLQKGFSETRFEDVDLSKSSHASTLSIWAEKIQATSEE